MFSLLMSVYQNEDKGHFIQALDSICNQTLLPKEFIIVKDGPLPSELDKTIYTYKNLLQIKVLTLNKNFGLAYALNAGIQIASQPWIMRFDSDDVCYPNRVEEQFKIALSNDFDLFGSQIDEFENYDRSILYSRIVPTTHSEILSFTKKRNPFNHMTVCFRTDIVKKIGGYPLYPFLQDYALWAIMLSRGARSMNSEIALVKARTGNGMIERRRGLKYALYNIDLQNHLVECGFKSNIEAKIDGLFRAALFLSPKVLRKFVYKRFLRKKIK